MENAKAYSILRTFSKSEINDFYKFLCSPYFNSGKNVTKLFKIIRTYHPDFSSRKLDPEKIHSAIFLSEPKSTKSVNNLFTRLIHLAELFLEIELVQNDEASMGRYIIAQYEKRKLETLFARKLKKNSEAAIVKLETDSASIHDILILDITDANHFFNSVFPAKTDLFNSKYTRVFSTLIESYYLRAYRAICKFSVTTYLVRCSKELSEQIEFLKSMVSKLPPFEVNPLLKTYHEFTELLEEKSNSNYFKLKKTLFDSKNKIAREDFGILLVALYYYCEYLNTIEQYKYDDELFDLVNVLMMINPWKGFGGIHEHLFLNTVLLGLRKDRISWTEQFVKDNIETVNRERRNEVSDFSYANLNLYKAKAEASNRSRYLKAASGQSQRYLPIDYYGKLMSYSLSILLNYEADNIEQLIYQCDSYEHYLKDHESEIPYHIFQSRWNFCKLAAKIGKLKYDEQPEHLKIVENELHSVDICAEKKWLESEILTLKRRKS